MEARTAGTGRKGLMVATGSRSRAFRSAGMRRRWTALVRPRAVASMLLLPSLGYGIGPHVQLDGHRPNVAAHSPAARAAERLDDASPADRARLEATLAAAGPEERPYLFEALAAGHSADEMVTFARLIRGRRPEWLRTHLSLIDPDGPGRVTYRGSRVRQTDHTTCGSMTILVARAMTDPLYALHFTTADRADPADASVAQFRARLTAEEHRIHDATNRFWPERLGSTPAGIGSELNRHADELGARYEPHLITGAGGKSALRDAIDAADNAQPVPVLIGDRIPRHYILLIGRDGADLLFYEPMRAMVDRISEQSFLDGKVDVLGLRHVYAVVTPSP